jgi:hypothetical protein
MYMEKIASIGYASNQVADRWSNAGCLLAGLTPCPRGLAFAMLSSFLAMWMKRLFMLMPKPCNSGWLSVTLRAPVVKGFRLRRDDASFNWVLVNDALSAVCRQRHKLRFSLKIADLAGFRVADNSEFKNARLLT